MPALPVHATLGEIRLARSSAVLWGSQEKATEQENSSRNFCQEEQAMLNLEKENFDGIFGYGNGQFI
jgi:hypothetical protein